MRAVIFYKYSRLAQALECQWQKFFGERRQGRATCDFDLAELHVDELHLLIELMHLLRINHAGRFYLRGIFFGLGVVAQGLCQREPLRAERIHNKFLAVSSLLGLFIAFGQLLHLLIERQQVALLIF